MELVGRRGEIASAHLTKTMNEKSSDALKGLMLAFEQYEPEVGTPCSPPRDCFLDEEEVNRRAPDPSAVLANDLLKRSLYRWKDGVDAEVGKYTPAPSEVLK